MYDTGLGQNTCWFKHSRSLSQLTSLLTVRFQGGETQQVLNPTLLVRSAAIPPVRAETLQLYI